MIIWRFMILIFLTERDVVGPIGKRPRNCIWRVKELQHGKHQNLIDEVGGTWIYLLHQHHHQPTVTSTAERRIGSLHVRYHGVANWWCCVLRWILRPIPGCNPLVDLYYIDKMWRRGLFLDRTHNGIQRRGFLNFCYKLTCVTRCSRHSSLRWSIGTGECTYVCTYTYCSTYTKFGTIPTWTAKLT